VSQVLAEELRDPVGWDLLPVIQVNVGDRAEWPLIAKFLREFSVRRSRRTE
jgi:hypothetical protein